MKPTINYEDFLKLDLRVGEIVTASEVDGSDKLLKLEVNFGPDLGTKTIFSGIKKWYTSATLPGKKLIFIINLLPKKFKINGVEHESSGMVIAADSNNEAVLYNFDKDTLPGSIVL